jgi:hypothetical protein
MIAPVTPIFAPAPPAPAPALVPPARREREEGALEVEAEVHDRHQLEFRFNYAIGGPDAGRRYRLDAFVFVPRNVGVSRTNYARETFYADVTALMRLDAVPLPLEDLARPDCPASPLYVLDRAIEAFRASRRPPPSLPLATQAKLYAYLYTAAIHREVSSLRARVDRALGARPDEAADGLEDDAAAALARARAGLAAFRRVRAAFAPFELIAHERFVEALRAADEYMSLFLEERLAPLALALGEDARYLDGSGRAARLRLAIAELLREEARYRAKHGFLAVGREGLGDGEYFEYRLSLLKKSVHQALYLDARTARGDTFLRNAIGAVGAALAAIWAFLATPLPTTFASVGGGARVLFFVGVVLAYVMKDRTKALTNEYLSRRLRRHDHVFEIEGPSLAAMGLAGLRVGLTEAMSFLSSAAVPAEVRELRLSRRTVRTAEAASEEVIRYRKELVVKSPPDAGRLADGFQLRDILRFNVRHFLVRLDDPLDPVVYFDAHAGTFVEANLPKVYHLNLVLRLERTDADGRGEARLVRFRLVINKEGIVRVDPVESRGPLAFGPAR